jgi:mannose-1-phosphate guanylyltransferase
VFALGHRAEKIIDYVQGNPVSEIAVETVVEPAPLGTAGALRHARSSLRSDPVLVINGDTFIDADLDALLAHHRRTGARATLLCTEVADAGRYGSVDVDASGFITAFREKDAAQSAPALINAGVYLLSAALLDDIAAGAASSLERDVFAREPRGALAAWVGGAHFIDIGTPDSLRQAFDVLKAAGVNVS